MQRLDERLGLLLVAGGRAEDEDRVQHLRHRVRVDGEHLGGAAEVGECIVDDRHVDRAHRAQVLGDDQVGVEPGQGALVEVVEVLAPAQGLGHESIDRGRIQALRHRAGGDDRAFSGLGRGVALEGHPDDVVARADREEDLGGRGKQGDNPHTSIILRLGSFEGMGTAVTAYRTVGSDGESDLQERGSRFHCTLTRVADEEDARSVLERVRRGTGTPGTTLSRG